MEILATYIAKDGKMFKDPLECEEYERGLGVINGSVADLIRHLNKQLKPETYLHGLVYVKDPDGYKSIYQCTTVCVDGKLDSFVNIENLTQEQRYITTTVKDLVEWLEKFDKDCLVNHFLVFSENIELKQIRAMTLYNPKVWEDKE